MIVLPLLEIVLRKTVHAGISGSSSVVQHLVLLAGMSGAAIAARQGDLLALSTVGTMLRGQWGEWTRVFTNAFSAAVTFFLGFASYQFLMTERESAKALVYHLPIWIIELAFPVGFALIAARIIWQASARLQGRGVTLFLSLILCIAAAISTPAMAIAALCLLAIA